MTIPQDVDLLISDIARRLQAHLAERRIARPLMIGIHSGGVRVAQTLHELLKPDEPLGTLDISFYRDDFTRIGMNPQVKPSHLPFAIDDRHIVLVDDVLYTGRTIRAALNEIFDYGRPATVTLVVLIDRGGRELPIQPDVAGARVELPPDSHIKLSGRDKLALVVSAAPEK